ncbi:DUF3667 domain-containing protein [Sphingomonas sp. RS2018]
MDDAIDTMGTVAAGGILAREVDRAASHRVDASGHDASGSCANCAAALTGPYCHACGQHGHVHRTIGAFVHDILHGVFHFEGRFWSTLPKLAFRPGELTRRYVHGERAKFVSPIALFLFSVFLMFAVVANLPGWNFGGEEWLKPGLNGGMAQARDKVVEQRKKADAALVDQVGELRRERADEAPDADKIQRLERRIVEVRESRRQLIRAEQLLPKATTFDIGGPGDPAADDNWLEHKVRMARDNPKLLFYKIKTSAYKFSWALIPISLPFIWILFPFRRDVGMYDHAIFATYSLTFMSLLTIVLAVLGAVGVPAALLLFAWLLIPPLHMYRQLKGAYGLSRAGTIWRLFWLLNFIGITTMLFTLLLLYLGVAD